MIKLHLREEFEKYARETEVSSCVKKFSQFTKYPIMINDNHINSQAPIWTRNPKEVTSIEYQEFYE